MTNLKNSPFVINMNSLVKEAMGKITDNQRSTVIAVDDGMYLQGILTDGDIRRAMLSGATMETPILKMLNINPIFIDNKNDIKKRADEIFQNDNSIEMIPIVDNNNKLIDVAIRDPEKRKDL